MPRAIKEKEAEQPLYLVEWFDAKGDTGWRTVAESVNERLAQVFSSGFVLEETDEYITIVQSISADESAAMVDNRIVIPKVNIVSVKQLIIKKQRSCKCEKPKQKNKGASSRRKS